jgi:hypothetical protein
MTTPQEIWIRQLIWAECRAGTDQDQILAKITAKPGLKSVSPQMIEWWYGKFKSGKVVLFDKNHNRAITSVIRRFSNREEVNEF